MSFERVGRPPSATVRARGLRRRMTWSEKRLWEALRTLDCNFRRQAPIGRYFADFALHGHKLVVEVDGGVHQRLEKVVQRDTKRQHWLESEGYTVLRFSDRQVSDDVDACVEAVRRKLGLPRDCTTVAHAPDHAVPPPALRPPPSPTLPPSRRKGA